MPSPFNTNASSGSQKGSEDVVIVQDSVLVCEGCFAETSNGTYTPGTKTLAWNCVACDRLNVVRNIEL